MIASICQFVLLAEAEQPAQGDANAPLKLLLWLGATGVLFYFLMLRPQKQKEHQLRQQVQNLKENDRVVTIGGIHGIVTNVQRDAERVTLRVDEATGAKIRFNMSAIARVLTGEDGESAASGTKT